MVTAADSNIPRSPNNGLSVCSPQLPCLSASYPVGRSGAQPAQWRSASVWLHAILAGHPAEATEQTHVRVNPVQCEYLKKEPTNLFANANLSGTGCFNQLGNVLKQIFKYGGLFPIKNFLEDLKGQVSGLSKQSYRPF